MPDTTIAERLTSLGIHGTADARLDVALRRTAHLGGDVNDVLQALADDPEAVLCLFTIDEIEARIQRRLGALKSSAGEGSQAGRSSVSDASKFTGDPTGTNGDGPSNGGAAKAGGASNVQHERNVASDPPRRPSAPRAGIDAYKAHSEVVAKSLFDSWKINGKPIGKLTWAELERAARDMLHDGHALRYLIRKAGVVAKPDQTKVADIVTEAELQRAKQKGAEAVDVL